MSKPFLPAAAARPIRGGTSCIALALLCQLACTSSTRYAGSTGETEGNRTADASSTTGTAAGVGGTGSTGTSATTETSAASTDGSGAAPGDCVPATRRCAVDRNAIEVCTETGNWQTAQSCPSVCRDGECVGECAPAERRCQELTPQRCSEAGQWEDDGLDCLSECLLGICTGNCEEGSSQCLSTTEVQSCVAGQWAEITECEFACVDGACGGVCVPGQTRCSSTSEQQVCDATGQWSTPTACAFTCANDSCTGECSSGSAQCVSDRDRQICDEAGQWGSPVACPYACVDGACSGNCVPTERRCTSPIDFEICSTTGVWGQLASCAYVCTSDGVCGENPKFVFVSSETYNGDLGGLEGADAKCQGLADAAGLEGTFLAWLSTSTASPASRFSKDAGPYRLVDGSVVANNWVDLTTDSLQSPINLDEKGQTPPAATPTGGCANDSVWSGTQGNGELWAMSYCDDWTDSTSDAAAFGFRTRKDSGWTASCTAVIPGETFCDALAPIYCFEQ